jgi:outer membrane protein assembly factor BamB
VLRKIVKLISIVALGGTIAIAGLYVAGVRIGLNGSGRPGFVSSRPDYDALEADRARQRGQSPAPPPESAAPVAQVNDVIPPPGAASAEREAPSPLAASSDVPWPDFRGRNRDGRYTIEKIRTDWPPDGLPRLWKQPIGLGYASFVVADHRAFTIEQRRAQEVAAAYDVRTGRELWVNSWDGEFAETMGGNGPRATPTYHDGRVYALGALGELRCLDASTGAVIWRKNILEDNRAYNLDWGMAASPLIVGETVVVLPGGGGGKSVVAYNRHSGDRVWSALDDRQAYTSPMLVTLNGVSQILVVTATRAVGLTTDGSRVLWEYPWSTYMGINVAQPVLLDDRRVFLSAAYDHGAALIDISKNADRWSVRTVWENNRMKNKFTSSVLLNGYLYGLDESILACMDAETGQLKWKGGRYGYGQVLLASDHLVVLTEDGDVVLVKATPDRHQEVARFPGIEGKTWNHPVVADGRLLVRNIREMAAFDIRPK